MEAVDLSTTEVRLLAVVVSPAHMPPHPTILLSPWDTIDRVNIPDMQSLQTLG